MRITLRIAAIGLMLAACQTGFAIAEKADRTKLVDLEADLLEEDGQKTRIGRGNVVLSQGTLLVKAERVVVKEDDEGYLFAQVFGTMEKPITFRQKREGLDEYFEGVADRAEYDNRTNTIKLFSRARLKSGTDDAKGEYIYYNSVDESYKLANAAPSDAARATGKSSPAGERAKITFQPKIKPETGKDEPAKK